MRWLIGVASLAILLSLGLPTAVTSDSELHPGYYAMVVFPFTGIWPAPFFGIASALCYAHGLFGLLGAYFMTRPAGTLRVYCRVQSAFSRLFAVFVLATAVGTVYSWMSMSVSVAMQAFFALNWVVVPIAGLAIDMTYVTRSPTLANQFHGSRLVADILAGTWFAHYLIYVGRDGFAFGGYVVLGAVALLAFVDALGFTYREKK